VKPEDLTESQLDRILNSKIVQKYVAYRSLTDGIQALKDDGAMFDTFVDGVHRREGVSRLSRDTVVDVIDAMVAEVEDNTAFIEESDEGTAEMLEDLVVDEDGQ
jgi:hypothetical protein